MSVYKDIDGEEYSTAVFWIAFLVMLVGSVVVGGAVAAILVWFASVGTALTVWLTIAVGGVLWSLVGLRIVKKRSKKVR